MQDAELSQGVAEINRVVHSLADAIYSPETVDAFTVTVDGDGSSLAFTSRKVGKDAFLFLVNMADKSCNIQVTHVSSDYSGGVELVGEARDVAAHDGSVNDTLVPYGVRLYRFPVNDE